ncbi:MAG: polysaccharide biosynthesis C-terminal domain-containing protein [Pseudomonadota bacterium]
MWRLPAGETRFSQLGKNSAFSLVQASVSVAASFIVYKVLLNTYGVEALGVWSLTVGAIAFARVADLSGGNALTRLIAISANEPYKDVEAIDTVTLFTAALYLAIGIIAYAPLRLYLSWAIPQHFVPEIALLLPIMLICLVLSSVGATLGSAIDGLNRADLRAKSNLASQLAFAALALALIPRFGIIGVAIAQLLQFSLFLIVNRVILIRHVDGLSFVPNQVSIAAFRSMIGYGSRLQFLTVAGIIFDPLTKVVINHIAGVAALAIYEIAYRIVSQSRQLILSASTPLVAAFAIMDESDRDQAKPLLRQAGKLIFVSNGLVSCGIILAAPLASLFFIKTISDEMIFAIVALSFGFMLNALAVPIYLYAQGVGVLRWNIISQLMLAIVTVLGCWTAAGILGTQYIAVGVFLGLASAATICLVGNARSFEFRLRDIVPLRSSLMTTAALFVSTGALAGLLVVIR